MYRPSSRDFELTFQEVKEAEAVRLPATWLYWERGDAPEADKAVDDELHPDHRPRSN